MKKTIIIIICVLAFGGYIWYNHDYTKPSSVTSATSSSTDTGATSGNSTAYKDGTYIGSVADAYYGSVQVQTTISGGKVTNVQFLQYPQDRSNSREINAQATPELAQEAIQAQSANVAIVSGATLTSKAFQESLQSTLTQAQSA